jgi:mannose-6-phosphate isomerase-like protein (cupin superfamily)
MFIVNRHNATVITGKSGSELRPLMDRTTAPITQCSLAEETLQPGASVTPHHHRELEEIYYLLSGEGLMTVGAEQRKVLAGDAVYIPKGERHTLENTGSEPLRLIVVCGPAFYYEDEIIE